MDTGRQESQDMAQIARNQIAREILREHVYQGR
jgi:hypothetical protein